MRVSRRLALIQRLAGLHSPVGQRHLAALRLKSAPANVHVPCSQVGGPGVPRTSPNPGEAVRARRPQRRECGSVKLRAQARQRKRRLRQQRQAGRPWHRQSASGQLRRSRSSSSQPPASARPAPRRSGHSGGCSIYPSRATSASTPASFLDVGRATNTCSLSNRLVVAPNPRPQDEGIEAARHAPVKWPTQAPGSAKGSSQSASTPVPSSASAPLMRPRWSGQTTAW
jgi:hypothetical protein